MVHNTSLRNTSQNRNIKSRLKSNILQRVRNIELRQRYWCLPEFPIVEEFPKTQQMAIEGFPSHVLPCLVNWVQGSLNIMQRKSWE